MKTSNFLAALAAIDLANLKSPDKKLGEGQTLAGTLPEQLIRLYGFLMLKTGAYEAAYEAVSKSTQEGGEIDLFIKAYKERSVQADFNVTIEKPAFDAELKVKTEAAEKAVEDAMREAVAAREVFWNSVRLEFDLTSGGRISLGENWGVFVTDKVKSENEPSTGIEFELVSLRDLLRSGPFSQGLGGGSPFGSLSSLFGPGFPGFGGGFPFSGFSGFGGFPGFGGGFPGFGGGFPFVSPFSPGGISLEIVDLRGDHKRRPRDPQPPAADAPAAPAAGEA